MATETTTTTRRAMIAAIAAVPAIGIVGAMPALASPLIERAAWDRAEAAFRKVQAESQRLWAIHERADEMLENVEPKRPDHLFDQYGLHMDMTRADAEYWLAVYFGPQPDKIARFADELAAYQKATNECEAIHECERLFAEAQKLNPAYFAARKALLEIPAPDNKALLLKIELTVEAGSDELSDALVIDARRVLAGEA